MKSKFQDEFMWIEHLRIGDEEAYAYLVDRFNHKLCTYACSLTNNPVIAQDIVQKVFIKIWERRDRLKSNFSFSNFLHKCVYNEFIDQYRKRQAVTLLERKYIEAMSNIVEQDDQSFERQLILIRKAIQKLPKKCRRVFLLSKQEGLSNAEIAEYLRVSTKAVEGHITRAFSILRKEIC